MHLRTCVSCEGGVLKNSEKTKRGKYGFSIVVYFGCDRRSAFGTPDHAVNRSGGIMRGYMDVIECKHCKYRDKCHREIALKEYDEDIDANYVTFQKLTFCSYGERREEWREG